MIIVLSIILSIICLTYYVELSMTTILSTLLFVTKSNMNNKRLAIGNNALNLNRVALWGMIIHCKGIYVSDMCCDNGVLSKQWQLLLLGGFDRTPQIQTC